MGGLLPSGIIGHRGARAMRPENSLEAFRYAMEHGVRAVELDVRLSRDGQLVCSHDPSPKRLGGPDELIAELAVRDLADVQLDGGVSIPTLEQVLDLVGARVGVVVELKNDPTEPDFRADRAAADVLADFLEHRRRAGCPDVIRQVSSFDHESATQFRDRSPALGHVAALLTGPALSARDALDAAIDRGLRSVHPHYSAVLRRPGVMRLADAAGVEICCWTVNSPRAARVLHRLGISAIITDDPVRLAAAWDRP
jgi:glycerophosphoryl diester phosphodiesterase